VGNEHRHFDSLKQKSIRSKGHRVIHWWCCHYISWL